MATWDEVRVHLRGKHRVERDDPAAFGFDLEVPVGDQVHVQPIGMAPTQLHGRPWLTIVAELFAETGLSTRGALVYADRLPFGALVLHNDRYLLRHGTAFDTLQLVDLDWQVHAFALEAVRVRVNLIGPARALAGDAFGNYAE
jgi:hypothetical protein